MTEVPGSPGRGPCAYQPAMEASLGSCRVSSDSNRSRIRGVCTSIAGLDSRTGRASGPATPRKPMPIGVHGTEERLAAPPTPVCGAPEGAPITCSFVDTPTLPPPHRTPSVYVPGGVDVGTV